MKSKLCNVLSHAIDDLFKVYVFIREIILRKKNLRFSLEEIFHKIWTNSEVNCEVIYIFEGSFQRKI